MLYRLYLTSRNRKLGPIPAAYIDRSTCPPSCRLLTNGCYAEHGPTRQVWNRVSRTGVDLDEFCRQVDALIGPRRLWRYGVAGDLPGEGDRIDPLQLDRLVQANREQLAGVFRSRSPSAVLDLNGPRRVASSPSPTPRHPGVPGDQLRPRLGVDLRI